VSRRYVTYQERVSRQNPKAATAWQARWEREFASRWEQRAAGLYPKMAPLRIVESPAEPEPPERPVPLEKPCAGPGLEAVHAQLDWLCARARGER